MRTGGAATLVLLASLALSCGERIPPVIREEQARTLPGVVTVVFFTDFQCPFCRRTHAALAAVLADHPGRMRVVLRHVPLSIHPDAEGAARAAICAEPANSAAMAPGAYDEFVNGLYIATDLGDAANEELAVSLGAVRETFHACVVAPATAQRIKHDVAELDALAFDGVPLLYVGRQRLEGSQPRRDLESAVEAELRVQGAVAASQ